MALIRFQPFSDEFQTLQQRIRAFTDPTFPSSGSEEVMGTWAPICDIYEDGDNIVVKAEIPGVDRNDIDVQVEHNVLTLRGERKKEKEVKAENVFRTERFYGAFVRSFTLPATVDAGRIKAEYRDGLLHVTLPKAEEAKPRKIAVLAS